MTSERRFPFLERYDLFVFDLDGTLADTGRDIARSVNHALGVLGVEPLGLDVILAYVGNGARVLLERALGEPTEPQRVEAGLAAFLEHYREQCVRETKPYPGVLEALVGLLRGGMDLAVLTNKPLFHTHRILESLGLSGFFGRVEGGDSFPQKKPDPAGLLSIVEGFGRRPDRTLFTGDSSTDVRTARAAGVASALVPYGFQPDAFEVTPADHRLSNLRCLVGGDRP